MFGGIAGLLFGSMLGNMGAFGDILALIINVIAIILVIRILIYFFQKWRNRNNPKPQSNVLIIKVRLRITTGQRFLMKAISRTP
ncbi:hypothetical protein [Listeria riparia]|uniref:Uncharacterized protein n=1 Tax=Listeria riparia FSL S10-1204 TaxID=1265816 RepID=W7DNP2_9LIST|nr:hypothetical protein [Listeria riparia]EUJ46918.1 hypothetical protein PRIP_01319 [Listeria riparia FSL S10-1204]